MVASKLPCTDEAKEVLRLVKAAAARGDLTIVGHAWKRMHERGAQREDLESAVASATNATPANDGRWRLLGAWMQKEMSWTLLLTLNGNRSAS